jgi:hypothetical protein
MFEPKRPRHQTVLRALEMLDANFLGGAQCFFGGGTRIVLELGEYRESADIDFLCSSHDGYRALRSTVTSRSLGRIGAEKLDLAREVIADRYGIHTFLQVGAEKLKIEVIVEGRIGLAGSTALGIPVSVLDTTSCCAEKFLANADRWGDESALGRDVIDLAFMAARWGVVPIEAGLAIARDAYGKVAARDAKRAATKMLERAPWRQRCVAALDVTDTRTLISGLRRVAASKS